MDSLSTKGNSKLAIPLRTIYYEYNSVSHCFLRFISYSLLVSGYTYTYQCLTLTLTGHVSTVTGTPAQTGTGTLIVTLKDVNDNFPMFAEDFRPVVYENEEAFKTIVQISAVDRDTAANGPPFEFWLPCGGGCPCHDNPTCGLFGFKFIPGRCRLCRWL